MASIGPFTFKSSSETTMDFKELKRQLKDVIKIGKDNQDVQGWSTDIGLWIKLQDIKDPKTIFYGCLLTSQGDAQRFIEDLKEIQENVLDNNSEEEEENSSEEGESDDKVIENEYPSFEKIISSLKTFYGISEDQNSLLREIRSLKIGKNEKVRDFNIRYRSLYKIGQKEK